MEALQMTQVPDFNARLGSLNASQAIPPVHFASHYRPHQLEEGRNRGEFIQCSGIQLARAHCLLKGAELFENVDTFAFRVQSSDIHESTLTDRFLEDEEYTVCDFGAPYHILPDDLGSWQHADGNDCIYNVSNYYLQEETVIQNIYGLVSHHDIDISDSTLRTVARQEQPDDCVFSNDEVSMKTNAAHVQYHDAYKLPREDDYLSVDSLHLLLNIYITNKDILSGRMVYFHIISNGLDFVPRLVSDLIRLFSMFASLEEADRVFLRLAVPSTSAWYMIISSHAMHGDNNIAVKLYTKMLERDVIPNSNILTCVMKSCTSLRATRKGEAIHNDIIRFGFQYDLYVASALIDFYSKCGKLSKAFEVFSLLPRRNVVIWSVMMDAFIQHGCLEQSFGLLKGMYQQGIEPNEFTYSSLISACGDDVNLVEGMQLHDEFIKSGLELDSQMGSSLIDMYSKCGCLMEAQDIFDDLPNRMVSCWNALIAGYTYNGHDLAAIRLFHDMKNQGCMPNCLTLSCILKACGNLSDVEKGRAVHGQAIYTGLHSDEYVQSSLIGMYCKCGHLEEAQTVFDCSASVNIVSWGALMSGYVQHGQSCIALDLFSEIQKNGITPSIHIYSSVLKACGSLGDLQAGINVHEQICECGVEVDSYLGSSLIDMYSKCGDIEAACTVFEELPSWNIVCCGAMIAGYVQHGCPIPAFSLYEDMIFKGIIPDRVIYMYILEACAIMGSSAHGMAIHHQVVASGLYSDMVVGNALVDMYVKCDCLVEAQRIFLSLEYRNKISWDAIIVAHVREKEIFIARKCLIKMAQEGLSVDEILFTDILAACRSNGDMKEAWNFFELMRNVYDITPSIQHFGCLINLLGDGGHLAEAEELLEAMPIPPDTVAWFSLLSACRIHRNVNLGLNCFHKVMRLDPGMGVAYVTMSSIYAEAGMWESKYWIDEKRRQIDAWKIPGRAWIEVNREVHEFTVGDRTHPLTNKIYATLRRLAIVCKEEGHVPQFGSKGRSLSDGTEEFENRSEEALLGHCEKLALAFGLVSTPEGATVRIVKNLRVCTDCHSVSKIISKVERREIIINDAYHVHHFSNGECSCEKHLVSG